MALRSERFYSIHVEISTRRMVSIATDEADVLLEV
jgi:hypothetical protein